MSPSQLRMIAGVLVVAAGLSLGASSSLAQEVAEQDLKLTGQYLEYDQANGVAILKEGAYLEHDGVKLWGDNIHGDLRRNLFYASGGVTFWRGDERFTADNLSYDTKTHRGSATNLTTRKGPALIKAKRLTLEPYRLLGYDVSTTTDMREKPGYRVDASKMILIPRNKAIFRNARFKVGETTVFRLPTYIINLANPEAVQRFNISPAWNPGKGFFLRTTYDYYFSDYFYGRLFYNPSQYQGIDYGVNAQYYLPASNGAGGQLNYTRFDAPTINQKFSRYDLRHQQTFTDLGTFTLNSVLTENEFTTGGIDRKLTVNTGLQRSYDDYLTTLSYDRLIDLDKQLGAGTDLFQYVSSTPRFVFNKITPWEPLGTSLPIRVDGSIARITEKSLDPGFAPSAFSFTSPSRTAVPREIDATKAELNLSFTPKPLALLNDRSRVSYSFRDSQAAYDTGDLRNFFSFLVNTNERWTRNVSTGFDYVFQDVAGDTPFASFDRLEPERHLLTSYLRGHNGRWFSGTLFQTQYDIFGSRFRNASSNFVFRSPSQREDSWALAITPVYQFANPNEFGTLSLNTIASNLQILKADRYAHTLITNYDYNLNRLDSVATGVDFLVGESIRAEMYANAAYSDALGTYDFTKLNLGLTKDLRAWEARLRWNTIQKEVYLEFYLKFAAKKRLQLGVNYSSETPTFLNSDQVRQGFVN